MSEIAKALRDRRVNAVSQMREVAERAADENRNLTAEEQGSFDAWNEEINKLDERIKAVLEQEERAKVADETFNRIHGAKPEPGKQPPAQQGPDAELDAKFRALGKGELRSIDVALPTAIERRQALVEQRAPILTTNVPMPTTFIGQLYQFLVDTSTIRGANPTIYTTQTGENLLIPRSTAEGAATWFGEGVQITESNPTLSSVTLGAFKVGKTIYVSTELVVDTGFDLLGFLAEHAGRNVGIAIDTAYVVGTGTGQPTGFVGSATVGVTPTAAAGNVTTLSSADFLFDLFHSVIPQYRPRASWVMNDQSVKIVRKLKDSTNQYIWQPGLQAGQPDTLLARPVYADPNMAVMAANAKSIAFGDFSGYWIRDVTPLRFDRSDEFRFDTDVVSFRVLYRTDGKLGDTNAIKLLQNPAT